MNFRSFWALGLVMLCAPALPQGKQDFTLVNKTGYTIEQVYVSAAKSKNWEEDVLGEDVLEADTEVAIRFPDRSKVCNWDLKVVYDDGEEAEWYGFNLCEVSRITLFYSRKSGETRAEYE